jgi:class 3 adenylate cyclase
LLAGDLRAADAWLPIAAETAESLESPIERNLVGLERARLLIARGEAETAGSILEECVVGFDRLGLLPMRASAIDMLAKLHDSAVASRPSAVKRYIMFTDICSSTQLNRELGDEQWLRVVAEHNRVVRRRLREFDGVEVKQTGDGMFAWFSDPGRAIRCACAAVSDMERLNPSRSQEVRLRAGVSAGEPLPMDGDLYGLSIAAAARICDAAEPGRVLAGSEVVRADPDPPAFRDVGTQDLKGLESGLRLVEFDPDDAATSSR